MEVDLGEGWIYHKSCKAFLFAIPQSDRAAFPSNTIVGCLIAETIKEAHKIFPCSAGGGSNAGASEFLFCFKIWTALLCIIPHHWVCGRSFLLSPRVTAAFPSNTIVGCLIAETIKEAYKILPCSADGGSNAGATTKNVKSNSTAFEFEEVIFQREVMNKASTVNSDEVLDGNFSGAIFCEKETVSAICGIRASWVAPSFRKQGIATKLLDAVKNHFYIYSFVMESVSPEMIAFSQPTSAGKTLASKYFGTGSFLVYKAENYNGEVVF